MNLRSGTDKFKYILPKLLIFNLLGVQNQSKTKHNYTEVYHVTIPQDNSLAICRTFIKCLDLDGIAD